MDECSMSKHLLSRPSKLITSKRKKEKGCKDAIKQGQKQSLAQQELGREWSCLNNVLRQVVTGRLQESQLQPLVSEQCFVCLHHTKCYLVTQRLLPPRNKSSTSSSVFKYKGEYGSKWPWCKKTQRHMAYLQRHVPLAIRPGPSIKNPNQAQGVVLTTKTCILKVNCWSHDYNKTVSVSLGLIISTNPQLKEPICPFFLPLYYLAPQASSLTSLSVYPSLTPVFLNPIKEFST